MAQDYQISMTRQISAAVNHLTIGSCLNRGARARIDVQSLTINLAQIKFLSNSPQRRPVPALRVVVDRNALRWTT